MNCDLTVGKPQKVLLLYILPLLGSALFQQLYTLADTIIAGKFAGQTALTAIGASNSIVNILMAVALGANAGCAVLVSRYFGAKENQKVKSAVSTALLSFFVLSGVLLLAGVLSCEPVLEALKTPAEAMADSVTYLNIYYYGLPFLILYNLGTGIFSALGDSKTPFLFLVGSSLANIFLDWVMVKPWGVAGVAWATFIAQGAACVLTLFFVFRRMRGIASGEKAPVFSGTLLKTLLLLAIPVILQNAFVSVGNFFVSKRINDISLDATTGFTAAFKLISMANVGVSQMTSGLANFCSQNKAVGQYRRIVQGYIAVLVYCLVTNAVFMTAFISAPEFFTRLFVDSEKLTADALAYSCNFIVIVTSFLPVVCVKIVCDGVVRGCGGNIGFTVSTFSDLILRVAFVYILVPSMGFAGVSWAWAIGWVLGMLVAACFFFAVPCLRQVFFKKYKPEPKPDLQ